MSHKSCCAKVSFYVSCDEVTTIDNQSWLSIHVYVIKEWKKVSIMLNLQRVVDGATFYNLTSFIVKSLMEFGGLSETNLANKLVSFGVDSYYFPGCEKWCHSLNYAKTCPICEWCALHGTSHNSSCSNTECLELGVKD